MIVAGIDIGAKNVHTVLIKDGELVARAAVLSGFDHEESAERGLSEAAAAAGIGRGDIDLVVATGAGRRALPGAVRQPTEVAADARGAFDLFPPARTVIDVGADEARAIKLGEGGKVVDFAVNEKCAAGSGAFTEAMARALETPVETIGALSLQSSQAIPMNAQCAVFAESEVVSLLHARTPKADIARAVHDAIANRIVSMARKVGINEDVVVIGGVARNVGFIASVERELGLSVTVPQDPEFVSALGAAVHAAEVRG